MRFSAGLTAAALSGLAAAASQQSADVYMFPSSSRASAETPSIPKEVARHIMLQRTSRQRYGSDLRDIPSSIDIETAVEHLTTFGKSPLPLFTHADKADASQLVIILEGAAADQSSRLREKLGHNVAFTISDPPSATANNQLMAHFQNMGVASPEQCELPLVINPFETDCWTGPSSVVKYDLRTSPKTYDSLLENLSRLEKFVADGDLEVLLVLLPESSRSSKLSQWGGAAVAGTGASLQRRRGTEMVLTDHDIQKSTPAANGMPTAGSSSSSSAARRPGAIPKCFSTLEGCIKDTNSCSGHGECVNKYGTANGTDESHSCFVCACKATVVKAPDGRESSGRKTVRWGGDMCQKEDISVQFWLIAGFTITIVGAVTFAIGLLFNVGEEKLPGVIGAGVSRSK
ncbi:hypothetical protein MYCTH_2307878 [Thermothelomyces thermophilus ATCC 42464]|uniref:Vacuolar sorting protein Vps3844 C-terminal domain-containing protein n=1 Tax=Thermothelomyces thermophilus (strain ATCC 42464 / BCRC 31852 / DSM 1799) TaxID=573729 RepID=G2QIH8_THET4|nr:uncharacterized protein MYCTH_2307878 [Thermothelomyces thermophilus ATCC 42464]AEO59510.1 hypothetical protein MYCTH_2307878 [Thermothelomyces thermophilus ATCC 42464]